MEFLAPYLDIVTTVLYLCSITVLLWGMVLCLRDFLASHLRREIRSGRMRELTEIKNNLGRYVLLALEVLIVADIIDSIVKPTFEDILRLAANVAIRTVISYFLNKEIRDSEQWGKVNEKKRSERHE